MSSDETLSNLSLLADIFLAGEFRERRIVLVDPDDPTGRTRNVYEDIDQEQIKGDRHAVITLFPEYSKASAKGIDDAGQVVVTHEAALRDICKMLEQGYVIHEITKD